MCKKFWDYLEGHSNAPHQHAIVKGKDNAITDQETKGDVAANQGYGRIS